MKHYIVNCHQDVNQFASYLNLVKMSHGHTDLNELIVKNASDHELTKDINLHLVFDESGQFVLWDINSFFCQSRYRQTWGTKTSVKPVWLDGSKDIVQIIDVLRSPSGSPVVTTPEKPTNTIIKGKTKTVNYALPQRDASGKFVSSKTKGESTSNAIRDVATFDYQDKTGKFSYNRRVIVINSFSPTTDEKIQGYDIGRKQFRSFDMDRVTGLTIRKEKVDLPLKYQTPDIQYVVPTNKSHKHYWTINNATKLTSFTNGSGFVRDSIYNYQDLKTTLKDKPLYFALTNKQPVIKNRVDF